MELLLSSMRAGGRSSAGMASPTVTHQGLPATLAGYSHLPSVPGNQVGLGVRLGVRMCREWLIQESAICCVINSIAWPWACLHNAAGLLLLFMEVHPCLQVLPGTI